MKNKPIINYNRMIRVRNIQIESVFMLVAMIFLFIGCVPERKIGTEFLNKRHDMTMVIRAPEWVKMVNQSADSTQEVPGLSQREKDSIRFYKSEILQKIKDSVLIDSYIKSLQKKLEYEGYRTLIASANDTVFPVKGPAFLINIGQIELDEQKLPYRDETRYQRRLYAADFDLIQLELCFWIEVSKIENGIALQPPKLLYDSYKKSEESDGHFELDEQENKVDYYSSIAKLTPEYVDLLASMMGTDHAERLNEYLLNEYIAFFFPDKTNRILYGVDPKFGTLRKVYSPPFKELQE